jgi:hypothetical protein
MPARGKAGLALLALLACGPLRAAPPDARAVITRCALQVSHRVTGIAALSKACPGVRAALDQLGLTAFLPPGWPKTLSAHGLTDLDGLLQDYAQPPSSAAPRAANLRLIAAHLTPPRLPPTWSQRIRLWIRHWAGAVLRPVVSWLQHLGPSGAHSGGTEAIVYGLIGVLLLAAAALLIIELRGAGLIRRRRQATRPRPHSPAGASRGEPPETESGEPDWALLREHPARVLRLLVDTLTRAHRLEGDHHLTCRELETQARFDTEIERDGFARVARLAERQIYGPPGATVLAEETLRDARMLHARLLAAAGKDGVVRP